MTWIQWKLAILNQVKFYIFFYEKTLSFRPHSRFQTNIHLIQTKHNYTEKINLIQWKIATFTKFFRIYYYFFFIKMPFLGLLFHLIYWFSKPPELGQKHQSIAKLMFLFSFYVFFKKMLSFRPYLWPVIRCKQTNSLCL